MTTVGAVVAILLAAVIGFATHRASLCNVRAVVGTIPMFECTGDICCI